MNDTQALWTALALALILCLTALLNLWELVRIHKVRTQLLAFHGRMVAEHKVLAAAKIWQATLRDPDLHAVAVVHLEASLDELKHHEGET